MEKASRRFQPGEGPSRGLLRDYEPSDGPSFQALDLSWWSDQLAVQFSLYSDLFDYPAGTLLLLLLLQPVS